MKQSAGVVVTQLTFLFIKMVGLDVVLLNGTDGADEPPPSDLSQFLDENWMEIIEQKRRSLYIPDK